MNLTPVETVRRYYESLVPGRRQELMDLLDPHILIEVPAGFPGSERFYTGLRAYIEDFLYDFYGAFDVVTQPEEFLDAGECVTVLGRIRGSAVTTGAKIDVHFAHVWSVRKSLLCRGRLFTDTAVLSRALSVTPQPAAAPAHGQPEIG